MARRATFLIRLGRLNLHASKSANNFPMALSACRGEDEKALGGSYLQNRFGDCVVGPLDLNGQMAEAELRHRELAGR